MQYIITLLQDRKEIVGEKGEIKSKEKIKLSVSNNYPYDEKVPVMDQDCFLIDTIKGMLPEFISNTNIPVDDIEKMFVSIKIETKKDKEVE